MKVAAGRPLPPPPVGAITAQYVLPPHIPILPHPLQRPSLGASEMSLIHIEPVEIPGLPPFPELHPPLNMDFTITSPADDVLMEFLMRTLSCSDSEQLRSLCENTVYGEIDGTSLLQAVGHFPLVRGNEVFQLMEVKHSQGAENVFCVVDNNHRRYIGNVVQGKCTGVGIEFMGDGVLDENSGISSQSVLPLDYENTILLSQQELQQRRPKFMQNNSCAHQACLRKFSLFETRHHCRSCGRSFCKLHSRNRAPLPHLYYRLCETQKVCNQCFEELSQRYRLTFGIIYVGQFQNRQHFGYGRLSNPAKKTLYEGQFAQEGDMTGNGRMFSRSNDRYEIRLGHFVKGRLHGRGALFTIIGDLSSQGSKEEGLKLFNRLYSQATRPRTFLADFPAKVNVTLVVGDFQEGSLHGYAVYIDQNYRYEGNALEGELSGSATMLFSNTDVYQGQALSGLKHGYGYQTFASGARHSGFFEHGFAVGPGIQQDVNGDIHVGSYLQGKRHGQGELFYAIHHAVYSGMFAGGLRHGEGEIRFGSATALLKLPDLAMMNPTLLATAEPGRIIKLKTTWVFDRPVGLASIQFCDGCSYEGQINEKGESTDAAGCTRYANGDCYKGQHENSYRNGMGEYTYATLQNRIIGKWSRGYLVHEQVACLHQQFLNEKYEGGIKRGGSSQWFLQKKKAQLPVRADSYERVREPLHPFQSDIPLVSRHGRGVLFLDGDAVQQISGTWSDDLLDGAALYSLRCSLTLSLLFAQGCLVAAAPTKINACNFEIIVVDLVQSLGISRQAQDKLTKLSASNLSARFASRCSVCLVSSIPLTPLTMLTSCTRIPMYGLSESVHLLLNSVGLVKIVSSGQSFVGWLVDGLSEHWGVFHSGTTRSPFTLSSSALQCHSYTGQWRSGQRHGLAYVLCQEGVQFVGHFERDCRVGFGVVLFIDPVGVPARQINHPSLVLGRFNDDVLNGVCKLLTTAFLFEGNLYQGIVNGNGHLQDDVGDTICCKWQDGICHGLATINSSRFSFSGELVNGQYSGICKLFVSIDGAQDLQACSQLNIDTKMGRLILMYEGPFTDRRPNGKGRLTLVTQVCITSHTYFTDICEYTGSFVDALFHGFGTVARYQTVATHSLPSSSAPFEYSLSTLLGGCEPIWTCSATWSRGLRHGFSKEYNALTQRGLIGTWLRGKLEGFGVESEGLINAVHLYSGLFKHGEHHGLGVSVNLNGDEFRGEHAYGLRHGYGSLKLVRGNMLQARWSHGQLCGPCDYIVNLASVPLSYRFVEKIEANFDRDVLHGSVKFYFSKEHQFNIRSLSMWISKGQIDGSRVFSLVYHNGDIYQGELQIITKLLPLSEILNPLLFTAENEGLQSQDNMKVFTAQLLPLCSSFMSLDLLEMSTECGPLFSLHLLAICLCNVEVRPHGWGCMKLGDGTEMHQGRYHEGKRHNIGHVDKLCSPLYLGNSLPVNPTRAQTLSSLRLACGSEKERIVYDGHFDMGNMSGFGTLQLMNRQMRITGEFKNNQPTSAGMYRIDDDRLQTIWIGPVTEVIIPQGLGHLKSYDGSINHVGNFVDGEAHGPGQCVDDTGTYVGNFSSGAKNGNGRWESRDGRKWLGVFEHNTLVATVECDHL